jgi:hypothetical protein
MASCFLFVSFPDAFLGGRNERRDRRPVADSVMRHWPVSRVQRSRGMMVNLQGTEGYTGTPTA